jgi:AcrR family transcriptional regulator
MIFWRISAEKMPAQTTESHQVELAMAITRRMGLESSEIRARLLDGAAEIIRLEGCGAVTAGRLAGQVGLKRHIVHYYFGTIEELLLALMRRDADRVRGLIAAAIESDNPLRLIWVKEGIETTITLEYMALSTHLKSVRDEFRQVIQEFRESLTEAVAMYAKLHRLKLQVSPRVAVLVLQSLAQTLQVESGMGISSGHAELEALVEAYLRAMTPRARRRRGSPRRGS